MSNRRSALSKLSKSGTYKLVSAGSLASSSAKPIRINASSSVLSNKKNARSLVGRAKGKTTLSYKDIQEKAQLLSKQVRESKVVPSSDIQEQVRLLSKQVRESKIVPSSDIQEQVRLLSKQISNNIVISSIESKKSSSNFDLLNQIIKNQSSIAGKPIKQSDLSMKMVEMVRASGLALNEVYNLNKINDLTSKVKTFLNRDYIIPTESGIKYVKIGAIEKIEDSDD